MKATESSKERSRADRQLNGSRFGKCARHVGWSDRVLAKKSAETKAQIRKILVPIDFSQPSLNAIQTALPLVKRFGATLHFVHVFESEYPLASMAAIPVVLPELEIGQQVRHRLKHLAESNSVALSRENIHAIKG